MGKRETVDRRETALRRRSPVLAGAALLGVAACVSEPEPRPQLIVQIDTDAPVVGQLGEGVDLSPAVAVDTVRIDVIGNDREVYDSRDMTAADPRDWPISFGIETRPGTSPVVRLRMRAFRASLASRGILNDSTTTEPRENVVIDRIVDLEQPLRGVRTVRVVLATACFGAPASFQTDATTCVDGARREARPFEGLLESTPSSLVGTAPDAHERRCTAEPPSGARCVPGGATVLGDPRLDGAVSGIPTAPQRPVLVSPFFLDEIEFTVGRYRRLVESGAMDVLPMPRDPSDAFRQYCTWLGANDATNDDYPLNCISYEAAAKACALEGGRLPTEAQWEHAARGRGRGHLYSWGDTLPECCSASIGRVSMPGIRVQCGPAKGIEPAASHVGGSCATADVSIDGVVDLAGSLSEVTADGGADYSDPCWTGPGLRADPECGEQRTTGAPFVRGGEWSAGIAHLASAHRKSAVMPSITTGFRCAYADSR